MNSNIRAGKNGYGFGQVAANGRGRTKDKSREING